jgi:hypothetical protein
MSDDFNPEAFLNSDIDGALDTKEPELPKDEYEGEVDSINPKVIHPRSGGDPMLLVEVVWNLDDDKIRAIFDRNLKVRQTLFIDTVGGPTGALATGKGKNVQLGRLREALRQNKPGQPWNWQMLIGQRAMVTAGHNDRIREDTGEEIREYRVSAVRAM